jgi:hypothetical protein
LAEKHRSWAVRGGVSRHRDRRRRSAEPDGGGPQGPRGHDRRPSAKTPRRDRRLERRAAGRLPAAPSRARAVGSAAEIRRPRRRAPPGHGHVLRSRRLDRARGETRRRGLARPRRRLSRRRFGSGRPIRRARAEEARRRPHGAVRLSDRPGERRRAGRARRARDPCRARGAERPERGQGPAKTRRAHRPRHGARRGRRCRRGVRRRAQCRCADAGRRRARNRARYRRRPTPHRGLVRRRGHRLA